VLARHLRYGGRVIGICGGMQMLGREIADPHGVEGAPGTFAGFGWLDYATVLTRDKTLKNVTGRLALPGADFGRPDGALSADGQILATYVHGLFDTPAACAALLAWAGLSDARRSTIRRCVRRRWNGSPIRSPGKSIQPGCSRRWGDALRRSFSG
jgi:adenosylcobyric acid synthase